MRRHFFVLFINHLHLSPSTKFEVNFLGYSFGLENLSFIVGLLANVTVADQNLSLQTGHSIINALFW